MSKIIDRALDIINDRLKTQTSELSPTMEVKQGLPGMAHGGHVLEDDYPTHYLPDVGRQVMADGGMPGRPDISQYLQQIQAQQAPMRQPPAAFDYAYTGAARTQGYEPNRPSWVAPGEYVQSFQDGSPTPYVYGYEPPKPAPVAPQAVTSGGGGVNPLQMMFLMRAMRGYAEGGMPDDDDPVARALQTAQSVSQEPMPDVTPRPTMPSVPSAEGRVTAPKPTLGSLFEEGKIPSGAPWSERADTEEAQLPTIQGLTDAVKRAIEHHTSLPYKERIKNGKEAIKKLIPYVGIKKDAPIVPLIGKNAKLMKAEAGTDTTEPLEIDGLGVETAGLSLSPAFKMGKVDTCPNHFSCKDSCLGKKSGHFFRSSGANDLSAFKGPRLNSLNKTLALMQEPEAFAVRLYDELNTAKTMAHLNGSRYGFRLNNISDLPPSIWKPIIEAHPDIDFYDYTKMNYDPVAPNHHITYSSTGLSQDDVENPNQNWHQVRKRLDGGDNVAMSFTVKSGSPLPEFVHDEETGKKYRVIDGDTHDFRPLDKVGEGEDGVVIGLHNKDDSSSSETAHIDSKGFLVKYDPKYKTIGKSKTNFERDENGEKIPTNRIVVIKPQPKKPSRVQITRSKGSSNV